MTNAERPNAGDILHAGDIVREKASVRFVQGEDESVDAESFGSCVVDRHLSRERFSGRGGVVCLKGQGVAAGQDREGSVTVIAAKSLRRKG